MTKTHLKREPEATKLAAIEGRLFFTLCGLWVRAYFIAGEVDDVPADCAKCLAKAGAAPRG